MFVGVTVFVSGWHFSMVLLNVGKSDRVAKLQIQEQGPIMAEWNLLGLTFHKVSFFQLCIVTVT